MTAMAEMRWGALLILLVGGVLPLSNPGWSQTTPVAPLVSTNPEEWQATDLSLLDFVSDGYDLVSVISPSSHTRTYLTASPYCLEARRDSTAHSNSVRTPAATLSAGDITVPARPGTEGGGMKVPTCPGAAGGGMIVPACPGVGGSGGIGGGPVGVASSRHLTILPGLVRK